MFMIKAYNEGAFNPSYEAELPTAIGAAMVARAFYNAGYIVEIVEVII